MGGQMCGISGKVDFGQSAAGAAAKVMRFAISKE